MDRMYWIFDHQRPAIYFDHPHSDAIVGNRQTNNYFKRSAGIKHVPIQTFMLTNKCNKWRIQEGERGDEGIVPTPYAKYKFDLDCSNKNRINKIHDVYKIILILFFL